MAINTAWGEAKPPTLDEAGERLDLISRRVAEQMPQNTPPRGGLVTVREWMSAATGLLFALGRAVKAIEARLDALEGKATE